MVIKHFNFTSDDTYLVNGRPGSPHPFLSMIPSAIPCHPALELIRFRSNKHATYIYHILSVVLVRQVFGLVVTLGLLKIICTCQSHTSNSRMSSTQSSVDAAVRDGRVIISFTTFESTSNIIRRSPRSQACRRPMRAPHNMAMTEVANPTLCAKPPSVLTLTHPCCGRALRIHFHTFGLQSVVRMVSVRLKLLVIFLATKAPSEDRE
ncbi:hypothetical protein CRG98_004734 [Punica granatum]|uniref:Uncharacterized protein n=1 Tax=Punica granatum TaxID=22663 RepID=A0A2I0L2L8_PUNGR|nr:hypothetical protein CRG98_004734 [Punica granatum]